MAAEMSMSNFSLASSSLGGSSQPDFPAPGKEPGKEPGDDRLLLLRALHASLARSRRALLALDLAGVRRGTAEQISLSHALRLEPSPASSRIAFISAEKRTSNAAPPGAQTPSAELLNAALLSELPSTALTEIEALVRREVRLHLALLRRAQHKLMVLANTLSGSSVDYGPGIAQRISSSGPAARGWSQSMSFRKTG